MVTWEPAVCRELRQGKGPEGKGRAGNQGLFQPSSPGLPCRLQCGGIPLVQVHMAVPRQSCWQSREQMVPTERTCW